jgi:LuxR family maltose regulon positive regulatory protein
VSRETLISSLEGPRAPPVVFVCAGPGWGKTTLLAQWASRSERPLAWVSADERDNDPIVFLTYLAIALDRVAALDAGVFEALASPGVSIEGMVVPRLGAALATMERPIVLVVDDLHVIENPSCLDAIAALAQHVPEGSQLALSARAEPALSLGTLRAQGLAREVGPDELRMDVAGARQVLSAAGLSLPDEQIVELTEHTEGWSAGLYLAALSIRARGAGAKAAASFSGSDRLVSDYLRSELIEHLPRDELGFLTRTAVLKQMSGPLCDAVLDRSDSAEMLESLSHSNLFLVPLDGNGEWYRYHHLFGELLRTELDRSQPAVAPRVLDRAIDWCVSNGQIEAAIEYAQEAGDVDTVARLVEAAAHFTYQSGRDATAHGWLVWLEAHGALDRNAAVAVLGALEAAMQGRPAEAARWADAAEHASYDDTLFDGSSSIDSWRALLHAFLCRRGIERMRADAELAIQTLARRSQLRPPALLLLATCQFLSGEVDQADDLLADVSEEALELETREPAAAALGLRASIAISQERWTDAEGFAEQALRIIRRTRLDEYPPSALTYAVAARVALHLGRADHAQELLVQAQRLRPRVTYALPYLAILTRLELIRAYLTLADAGGGETIMREVDAISRRQPALGTLPSQVEELRESLKRLRANAPGASTLTEAELRVLPYLATQLSFREVGERLYLSRHTVKSHAMAIYRKLSVTSRTAAVERASEIGML